MRPLPLQVHPRRQPALASLICFSLVLFLTACGGGAGDSTGPQWQLVGLSGRFVHEVVFPPGSSLVYAATERGLYVRTRDLRWKTLVPTGEVWGVYSGAGGRFLLTANGDGSVHVSHDGGHSWRRTLVLAGSGADAFAWASDSRVFAATVAGGPRPSAAVFQSFDGGSNWRPWGAGLPRAGVMSLLV